MQLIGYLDSPFVRRTAISMRLLDIGYVHRKLSVFRDFEEFQNINPLVKVPTVVLDDGQILVDSSLIIQHLETHVAGRSLMPANPAGHATASRLIGIALAGMEKAAGLVYETTQRPEEMQHPPWRQRLEEQLYGSQRLMNEAVASIAGTHWLFGDSPTQADISIAVAWRFMQHWEFLTADAGEFPALAAYSEMAERHPAFLACPLSE